MTEEQAIERLPWLLNGTLDPEEAAEVRRVLETSEQVREELESYRQTWDLYSTEPPVEDLVAFVEGKLDPEDQDRLTEHLARSEAAREEVALLRQGKALINAVDDGTIVLARTKASRSRSRSSQAWRPALAAAMLTAVVASLVAWLTFRSLTPVPEGRMAGNVNVPIVEVLSAASLERGDFAELPSVRLTAGADRLVLILVSEEDPGAAPLELEAADGDDEVFWTAKNLLRDPRGEYTVSLKVPTGVERLNLRIYAMEDSGRREVEHYRLRVERGEVGD